MQNPFLSFFPILYLTTKLITFFHSHSRLLFCSSIQSVASTEEMQLILPTLCVFFLQLLLRGGASASAALAHSSRHAAAPHWLPATATWYGSPEGDGSSGGACGYGSLVDVKPLKARVGAVSPALFKSGEGCGACYKVRCLDKTICSKRAVTIIVTDQSPSGPSARAKHTHFDLSGAAFGHLAIPGHSRIIRNRGLISLLYRRTACKYRGKNIAFHVNAGSTAYWLSLLIEFEDGEGDIGSMHIRQAGSKEWIAMKHIWGANWCIVGGPLKGPLSVKLTTLSNNKTLSATDVIPQKWVPKATYTSRLNFSPVL